MYQAQIVHFQPQTYNQPFFQEALAPFSDE
jgi:hypothetical protein